MKHFIQQSAALLQWNLPKIASTIGDDVEQVVHDCVRIRFMMLQQIERRTALSIKRHNLAIHDQTILQFKQSLGYSDELILQGWVMS